MIPQTNLTTNIDFCTCHQPIHMDYCNITLTKDLLTAREHLITLSLLAMRPQHHEGCDCSTCEGYEAARKYVASLDDL